MKENTYNSSTNTKEQTSSNYSEPLTEQIEHTPFFIVSTENGHFIAMGAHRMTDYYTDREEALNNIRNKPWEFLLNVMSYMAFTTSNQTITEWENKSTQKQEISSSKS